MIKSLVCILVLIVYNTVCFSQNKNEFSVEFNVNQNSFKMGSLNSYLLDTLDFYNENNAYQSRLSDKKFTKGLDFNSSINFQISETFGLGVYVNGISSSIDLPMKLIFEPYPGFPDSNIVIDGVNKLAISAIGFGISSRLNLNKLLGLQKSQYTIVKNIDFCTRLMFGGSSTKFEDRIFLGAEVRQYSYSSQSFHGKVELALGYRFYKTFISAVGFKVGYSYLKTGNIINSSGSNLMYGTMDKQRSVSLDFSGTYYGIYLSIGK